jgi:hypothetical protein
LENIYKNLFSSLFFFPWELLESSGSMPNLWEAIASFSCFLNLEKNEENFLLHRSLLALVIAADRLTSKSGDDPLMA